MLSTIFSDDLTVQGLASTSFELSVVLNVVVTVGGNCGLVYGPRCVAAPTCPTSCPFTFQEMRKQSISGVGSVGFARFLSVSKKFPCLRIDPTVLYNAFFFSRFLARRV